MEKDLISSTSFIQKDAFANICTYKVHVQTFPKNLSRKGEASIYWQDAPANYKKPKTASSHSSIQVSKFSIKNKHKQSSQST